MADFRIDVIVSPRQAQAGIGAVENSLEKLNRTAASTNSLLRNALQVAGLASGVVVIQRLVANLIELSDAYTEIQNKLSFVTKNTSDLSSVTDKLIGVSNRSRSSFEATAQLYSRTALAADQLGLSQDEILKVTETLNKAIILSGASAKEASNGLIQLSQAIASNRLGGDELRSVLEQLPVVADAISRSLGITRGQLRELGSQGVLTAKVITDALQLSAGRIEAAFAKTVPTVGQALQVLENNLIAFVGEANKASGASQKFAAALVFLGRNLENLVFLTTAALASLAVKPLVLLAEKTLAAAAAQRAFAAEVAAGIAGPRALAAAAEAEAAALVATAEAKLQDVAATASAIEIQRGSTLVTFQATEAAQAQAAAELQVAASRAKSAKQSLLAAESQSAAALAQREASVSSSESAARELSIRIASAAAEKELALERSAAAVTQIAQTRAEITALAGREAAIASEVVLLKERIATELELTNVKEIGFAASLNQALGENALDQATLVRIAATRESAVVSQTATAAGLELAQANFVAAEADIQKASSALIAANAERDRLVALDASSGALVAQAAADATLAEAELAHSAATSGVAVAERELQAAVEAGNVAAAQRIALDAQLVGLEEQREAAVVSLTLAEGRLAAASAAVPGRLAKLATLLRANVFGIAVVGITAVVVGLIGIKDLLDTVTSGFSLLGRAIEGTTTFFRNLAESVPVVGGAFGAVLKTLLGIGAIVVAVFQAPVSPILALTLAIAGLVTLLGTGKQVFDAFGGAARAAISESAMIAPIGQEILAVRRELEPLEQEFERLAKRRDEGLSFGGLRDAEIRIEELKKRLAELGDEAKKQQGFSSAKIITSAFERRNELLREEIALLGKTRFEREVGLQLLKEEESFRKTARRGFTPEEEQTRKALIEAKVAGNDLAAVLDDIRDKRGPDQEFERLKKLLDDSGVSAELYAAALAELQRQRVASSPLAQGLKELRDLQKDLSKAPVLSELTFAGGTDPRAMLEEFRALNRERAIQEEIRQRTESVASGLTPEELTAAKVQITALVRGNAERARRNELDGQFLEQQSQMADAATLALIPDSFERSVQAAVQAQRDLKDASLQFTEAQIRSNLAQQEAGSILQGLTDPILARTQAQAELNAQIARQNALFASGALSAAQYGVVLQELEFRAAKLGTSFHDGLTVAFREFQAATTEAAVAQTALTSAINAASDASAEFVRTGTVDFKQLAISVLADISRIITRLLILRAVEAATAAFGGGTAGGPVSTVADIEASGNFIGGFSAAGGPIRGNKPFVVGELGPELFVPGARGGTVVPNDQVVEAMAQAGRGGASAPVVVPAPQVNVTVMNVTDPDDSVHSDAGEKRVLNIIERNPNRIRRLQ